MGSDAFDTFSMSDLVRGAVFCSLHTQVLLSASFFGKKKKKVRTGTHRGVEPTTCPRRRHIAKELDRSAMR